MPVSPRELRAVARRSVTQLNSLSTDSSSDSCEDACVGTHVARTRACCTRVAQVFHRRLQQEVVCVPEQYDRCGKVPKKDHL